MSNYPFLSMFINFKKKLSYLNCTKVRSSYFNVLPSRFFPLITINQTTDGLRASERVDADFHKFSSLHKLSNLIGIMPISTGVFKVKPYDLYCPSSQTSLLIEFSKYVRYFWQFLPHPPVKNCHKSRDTPPPPKVRHIFEFKKKLTSNYNCEVLAVWSRC